MCPINRISRIFESTKSNHHCIYLEIKYYCIVYEKLETTQYCITLKPKLQTEKHHTVQYIRPTDETETFKIYAPQGTCSNKLFLYIVEVVKNSCNIIDINLKHWYVFFANSN